MNVYKNVGLIVALCGMSAFFTGCAGEKPAVGTTDATSATAGAVDDHSGWWCSEHGIPEEECSMCSAAFAKACKDKGDWCAEHNRAESQCFICDASRAEKYAKLYEAKYGEKPPAVTE